MSHRTARIRVAATEGTLPYLLAPSPDATRALVMLVHGQGRRPLPLLEALAPALAPRGLAVAAPLFERRLYPDYQRLGGVHGPLAAAAALRRTTDAIQDRLAPIGAGPTLPVVLLGFSGGAQFAHRFAMTRPAEVAAVVAAAAGWYSMPDPLTAFPHGVAAGNGLARDVDLAAFLRLPVRVFVGEDDTGRDRLLNTAPALDEMQGPHRLERARRWVRALHEAAAARGLEARVHLELLPGTGHSALEALQRGGLAGRALRFIDAALATAGEADGC